MERYTHTTTHNGFTYRTDNLPHTDDSGDATLEPICSVLDDSGTGGNFGTWMTPAERAEYNDGMARLAEWG